MIKYAAMKFTVSYRSKDGKIDQMQVEASDRSAVFAELSKRGISAVRVEESTGKSKSRKTAVQKKSSSAPAMGMGLLAGVLVVIAAAGAFWLVIHGYLDIPKEKKDKKQGKIAEVAPALSSSSNANASQTNKSLLAKEKVEKPKKIHYWEQPTTNGLSDCQILKWKHSRVPPPSYTNNFMQLRPKAEFEIFEYRSENEIAALLTLAPGEGIVGDPYYDDAFREEFMKSCEAPIIIDPEDSEYDKQLKQDMIQTKIELRQRMADGEDICQIMAEARAELMRLGNIRQEIESQLHEMLGAAESEAAIEDCIQAANTLLEAKGIAPIQINPITKRRLKINLGLQ